MSPEQLPSLNVPGEHPKLPAPNPRSPDRCSAHRPSLGRFVPLTLAIFLTSRSAPSATVSVCDENSLRTAIAGTADQIHFECDGVIKLSAPLVISRTLSLDATGRRVTLDGNGTNRVFVVATNVTVQLKGLTCIRGKAEFGGAIWNQGGQLTLENCRFDLNESTGGTDGSVNSRGGAIFSKGGSLSIFGSSLSSNTCSGSKPATLDSTIDAFGGAIAVDDTPLRLENTRLVRNRCVGGMVSGFWTTQGSARGGALSVTNADAALIGCAFLSNSVDYPYLELNYVQAAGPSQGGALIHLGKGNLNLTATTFDQNTALGPSGGRNGANGPGEGGAIYAETPVTAENCRFTRNYVRGGGGGLGQASDSAGGALYLTKSSRLQACFLEANNAEPGAGCLCGLQGAARNGTARGGAVFASASLDVFNCSFYSNRVHLLSVPNYGGIIPVPNANMGGALYATRGAQIVNSTFLFNQAIAQSAVISTGRLEGPTRGAAIVVAGGLLSLTSSTFATNFCLFATNEATPAVTLLAPSTGRLAAVLLSGNFPSNILGSFVDLGGNLSSDASAGFTNSTSLTSINAKLGSPKRTALGVVLPLQANSPALDAATADLTPDTDELGNPRPVGARSDIGAMEIQYPPSIVVSTNRSVEGIFVVGANQKHTVQFTGDFMTWDSLVDRQADATGRITFSDPLSAQTPWRFYRTQRAAQVAP